MEFINFTKDQFINPPVVRGFDRSEYVDHPQEVSTRNSVQRTLEVSLGLFKVKFSKRTKP